MALARAAAAIAATVSSGATRRIAAPAAALARIASTAARASSAAGWAAAAPAAVPVRHASAAAAPADDQDSLPATLAREIAFEESQEPVTGVLRDLANKLTKQGFKLAGAAPLADLARQAPRGSARPIVLCSRARHRRHRR